MATFTAIPEKTQNATAMKRVLNYVMQDKQRVCFSGSMCNPSNRIAVQHLS